MRERFVDVEMGEGMVIRANPFEKAKARVSWETWSYIVKGGC